MEWWIQFNFFIYIKGGTLYCSSSNLCFIYNVNLMWEAVPPQACVVEFPKRRLFSHHYRRNSCLKWSCLHSLVWRLSPLFRSNNSFKRSLFTWYFYHTCECEGDPTSNLLVGGACFGSLHTSCRTFLMSPSCKKLCFSFCAEEWACGSRKVQPGISMKAYVSVVQMLLAFSKAHSNDSEPREYPGKQRGWWFFTNAHMLQPESSNREQNAGRGRTEDFKSARHQDRFDSRLMSR